MNQTSAPIGAWELKLPALLGNYDRPTNKPTDQPTDGRTEVLLGKLHFQQLSSLHNKARFFPPILGFCNGGKRMFGISIGSD